MPTATANIPPSKAQRVRVSVVIITRNEERNIRECLESVRWADDIVVVDSESTDRTVELAGDCASKVFVRPWPGYGAQKNFGIAQAVHEWILVIDADERVTDALRDEIHRVMRDGPGPEVAGFQIPRRNFFYGRWIRGGGMYPDFQLRLFKRSSGGYDDGLLHERLSLAGEIRKLDSPLDHYSMPSVHEHVCKMIRYTTLGAQEKLKVRSRVGSLDLGGSHLVTIVKTYLLRGGFRDGVWGLIVAMFAGMHTFVKYAKAWEHLNTPRR